VTRRQDVTAAVAEVRLRLGPIDLVVANAGIGNAEARGSFDAEADERVYMVNVVGALNVVYACLPAMIEAGGGRVCGISSLASYQGIPGKGKYCGSKAALRVHLEALRAELRPKGILVTTVCPGFVRTPMTDVHDFDMPFLMEVDDAARRVIRAIDRGKREVRFPAPMSLAVRLGRLVPRALYDRAVRREPKGPRKQSRSTDG
jgi:short-subunit dehydrogenase